ncbi:hypothetical protein OB69_16175 [Roseivirga seohaensis subsp. aquiponti]|uniref:Lipoprotein n=1 Tax=Roseivirga seohaensis subsp. aquiponti TaxID=1566026 RepID=A0A0L8AHX1_9BACT|nr:hypothetical protein [Roseivirga seohaensis]KOF01866.1 hypothetical protein OB69_16175 [Roseivirga seohaensis subsp. aquiponti]
MKKQLAILAFAALIFTACGEDDKPTADDCGGEVCTATVGTDETAATVPANLHGTFVTVLTYAESNSPVALGTEATFTISATKLVVSIDGRDCFSIENAVHRFGATPTSGNYTFKAACIDDIAFNISANTDGSLNEINLEKASGTGFYGQFTVK